MRTELGLKATKKKAKDLCQTLVLEARAQEFLSCLHLPAQESRKNKSQLKYRIR